MNDELKITSGEWTLARATQTNSLTLILNSDNEVIADTYFLWSPKKACESYAQLIKASPKLYKALKNLLEATKHGDFTADVVDDAYEALSDARGELEETLRGN